MLNELAKEIREINEANGWNTFQKEEWKNQYKIPAIIALIHSEASEALEAFRANDVNEFVMEAIDVIIRTLDVLGGFGINIDKWMELKMEKNRKRGYRHGGKRA